MPQIGIEGHMSQMSLLQRDGWAALADDCDAVDRKKIAYILKSREPGFNEDKFDPEDGARWVSSCLKRTRGHKFDLDEIEIIVNEARKVGSHSYVTYLLEKTWYEPTKPKGYDTEVQKIGDNLTGLFEQATGLINKLQELRQQVKK